LNDAAAFRPVRHGRDQQINLSLLKKLDSVEAPNWNELELDAEALGNIGGKIRLDADHISVGSRYPKGL